MAEVRYIKIQEKIYVGAATRPALYNALVEFDVPKMRLERLLQLAEIGLAAENAMRGMAVATHQVQVLASSPGGGALERQPTTVGGGSEHSAATPEDTAAASHVEQQPGGGIVKIGIREGAAMSRHIK